MTTETRAQATHAEITAATERLVRHILEPDPKVISPHTRTALDAAELLALLAHASVPE